MTKKAPPYIRIGQRFSVEFWHTVAIRTTDTDKRAMSSLDMIPLGFSTLESLF